MFYLLTPILGLALGIIIAFFTKEELKPGLRYFNFVKRALLALIALFLIIYDFNLLYFILGFVLGIIIRQPYLYFALFLPLIDKSFLLVPLSLIFIFGLIYGTLKSYYMNLNLKKIFLGFLIIFSIFLIALTTTTLVPYAKIISLASGALIVIAIKPKLFYPNKKKK